MVVGLLASRGGLAGGLLAAGQNKIRLLQVAEGYGSPRRRAQRESPESRVVWRNLVGRLGKKGEGVSHLEFPIVGRSLLQTYHDQGKEVQAALDFVRQQQVCHLGNHMHDEAQVPLVLVASMPFQVAVRRSGEGTAENPVRSLAGLGREAPAETALGHRQHESSGPLGQLGLQALVPGSGAGRQSGGAWGILTTNYLQPQLSYL